MFGLSVTTGYAIQALSCLEACQDRLVQANEIAECTQIPRSYLSKIMHALGKAGLIHTKRGYRGGFSLVRPSNQISLFDIAVAIEGDATLPRCLLGFAECSDERGCLVHDFWKKERSRIESYLKGVKLSSIAEFEREYGQSIDLARDCPTCGKSQAPHSDHGDLNRTSSTRNATKGKARSSS